MNRLAFLRLTLTCFSILDSIYIELEDTDEDTIQELQGPIQVLESCVLEQTFPSFEKLLSVIEAQINTPFPWLDRLKRSLGFPTSQCDGGPSLTISKSTA